MAFLFISCVQNRDGVVSSSVSTEAPTLVIPDQNINVGDRFQFDLANHLENIKPEEGVSISVETDGFSISSGSMIESDQILPEGAHIISGTISDGNGGLSRWTFTITAKSPFISLWQTMVPKETITLPLRKGFNYDFAVDWGDGSSSEISSHDDPDRVHTYMSAGTYTVSITGLVQAWHFNNKGDKDRLLQVTNLGDVDWRNFEGAFRGCLHLTTFRGGNVSGVTNMAQMFSGATNVNPDVAHWDTSSVTNMNALFAGAQRAVPDVSAWDTSRVMNMGRMFSGATSANPNVSGWDTSSVKKMRAMFYGATSADPDVRAWDTSSVTDMNSMFLGAISANPDVSDWNISSVTEIGFMFSNALSANPSVASWDFSGINEHTSVQSSFLGVNFSTAHYSILLMRLDATLSDSITGTLSFPSVTYSSEAATARGNLVKRGWRIEDAGEWAIRENWP